MYLPYKEIPEGSLFSDYEGSKVLCLKLVRGHRIIRNGNGDISNKIMSFTNPDVYEIEFFVHYLNIHRQHD